jgi:hypothetical protein
MKWLAADESRNTMASATPRRWPKRWSAIAERSRSRLLSGMVFNMNAAGRARPTPTGQRFRGDAFEIRDKAVLLLGRLCHATTSKSAENSIGALGAGQRNDVTRTSISVLSRETFFGIFW